MSVAITLHLLATLVWVGGMFFAYQILRPAALGLQPPERLPLWLWTFARFFPWVWAAVIILPVTGYWMLFGYFGGFKDAGIYIHIMHALGWAMIALFLHVFFAPYSRFKKAVKNKDYAEAAKHLASIRRLIGINLSLGVVVVIDAVAGAYWLS